MNISVLDGSSYFKGLLLLIRKDKKITNDEHELMTRIGKNLGFEKKFIENAIREILDNKYISPLPPVFSKREIAEKFLKDGVILASSDNEIHKNEQAWLLSVAESNSIEEEWLNNEISNTLKNKTNPLFLEADNIKVVY